MDPNSVVLDISSDEELDGNDRQVNIDWWCDQLFNDGDGDGDYDDVVVVREVYNPQQSVNKSLSSPAGKQVQDWDDDDCMILDGDPDKMVSVEENQDDGSDELVVVGEKGQIACRDYPHPRHLCVKYPFSSTLHNFHCEQCHCYVCDIIAPCNLWGTGMCDVDHCHATDKHEVWKTERKNFKLKRCYSLPAIQVSENTSSFVPPPVMIQISNQVDPLTRSITMPINASVCSVPSRPAVCLRTSALAVCHVPSDLAVCHVPSAPRHVPSAPAVRPAPSAPVVRPAPSAPVIRPVPSAPVVRPRPSEAAAHPVLATNSGYPNINQRSGSNKFSQSSVSQHLPGRYPNYTSQTVRYRNIQNLGPSRLAVFKNRPTYHYGYNHTRSSISSSAQNTSWSRPLSEGATNRDHNQHKWINLSSSTNTGPVHNPSLQSHNEDTLRTSAAHQYITSNQPMSAAMNTQNLSQQVNYPSNMTASRPNVSVPWANNANFSSRELNEPLQTEVASLTGVSVPWATKTNLVSDLDSKQLNQLLEAESASIADISTTWMVNSNGRQVNQSMESGALGFQGPQCVNAASDQYQPNEQPGRENLHFELEDWLMENQPVVGNRSEPPLFSDQNNLSPDDAHMDPDLLYDDWNDITNLADL
ncbi:unnamed protein product [Rhodiola kirilowii]